MRRFWPLALLLPVAPAFVLRAPEAVRRRADPQKVAEPPRHSERVPAPPRRTHPRESLTPRRPAGRAPSLTEQENGWFLSRQREDGGWEGTSNLDGHPIGPTGVTALVLLSFFAEGWTHLSKEEVEGRKIGDAIRHAVRWLLDAQRPDGSFDSVYPLDSTLATLALAELYGLTGSKLFADPSQLAIDGVMNARAADGRWTVWDAMAAKSAQLSDLRVEPEAARRWFENRLRWDAHPGTAVAHILLSRERTHPGLSRSAAAVSIAGDVASRYLGSLMLFQLDLELWRARREELRAGLPRPGPDVATADLALARLCRAISCRGY